MLFLFLASFCLANLLQGCAKDPAVTFDHHIIAEESHRDFLRLLDERYASGDLAPRTADSLDSHDDLGEKPEQPALPNSIRFYDTPCIASREILMIKGEVRYRYRPEFVSFMEDWEAGKKPEPNADKIRYVSDLTAREREKKRHIIQSVKNYCAAKGGTMRNKIEAGEDAYQSYFLPLVAQCDIPDNNHDAFIFVYNPNIINNGYGYIPKILADHNLTPHHEISRSTGLYSGYSTVTMIRATPDCLAGYPVEHDASTGILTFGWDGYFFFIHPEHQKDHYEDRVIYFDRNRKGWM